MDDAEHEASMARVATYARILRASGTYHFDAGPLGSPLALMTTEDIEKAVAVLDSAEADYIDRMVDSLKMPEVRVRCEMCRDEMFGLCDECSAVFWESAKSVGEVEASRLCQEALWEHAEGQMDACAIAFGWPPPPTKAEMNRLWANDERLERMRCQQHLRTNGKNDDGKEPRDAR
jgi:hypothetical protein